MAVSESAHVRAGSPAVSPAATQHMLCSQGESLCVLGDVVLECVLIQHWSCEDHTWCWECDACVMANVFCRAAFFQPRFGF